jgi:hypothetical protein
MNSNKLAQIKQAEKELKQLEEQYKELAADATLTAASMAPPPWGTAADVVSIGKSLWSGDWGGALLDAVGLIPVVGDTIKGASKGTKIAAKMDEVADAIKAARKKLATKKDNLINGSKKNKKELDDATNGCSTKNCANKKKINSSKKGNKTEVDDAADVEQTNKPKNKSKQDKMLSKGEIKKLKGNGYDIHDLKGGKNASRYDLYKDKNGNIYVKRKGGVGDGEALGININDL